MAIGPDSLSQPRDVVGAVCGIDQKMKGGPVMPDVEGVCGMPLGDVSGDPFHLACASAEPRFGGIKGCLRNIQHRHTA